MSDTVKCPDSGCDFEGEGNRSIANHWRWNHAGPCPATNTKCECECCGREFWELTTRVECGKGRFCSDDCKYEGRRKGQEVACGNCGETQWVADYALEVGWGQYCDRECYNEAVGPGSDLEFPCPECGRTFRSQQGLNSHMGQIHGDPGGYDAGKDGAEKECSSCNRSLPADLEHFYRLKNGQYRLSGHCRQCALDDLREWRKANRPYFNARQREDYVRNRDYHLQRLRKRWRDNPDKWRRWHRQYRAKRRKNDPAYALIHSVRTAVRQAISDEWSGWKWSEVLDYTPQELRDHLEGQFQDRMTWENYGDWHVDHVVPISAFNFDSPHDLDFKRCWSLDNLQPLWAEENIAKSDKLESPFQPSLALGGHDA